MTNRDLYSQIVFEPKRGGEGAFVVEAIDIADGAIEIASFEGPSAYARGEAYLLAQYGGSK